jgi:hypothetical protein
VPASKYVEHECALLAHDSERVSHAVATDLVPLGTHSCRRHLTWNAVRARLRSVGWRP